MLRIRLNVKRYPQMSILSKIKHYIIRLYRLKINDNCEFYCLIGVFLL